AGPFPDGGFPPFPDGGIPPFPDGGIPLPDAGVNNCPFVDTYSTNFFGSVFFFNFTAAGTWGAGMTAFEAENNPQIGGTYGYVDPVILINDNAAMGGGCPPTDTGFYNLQFNATCDVFAPQLIVDPCSSRAMTLSGATFTRVP
ncbi:MAG: hypothetical protein RL846_02245, partial [Deltaproteobacteria bacterium]